jgi:hypothetical protein
MNVLWLILNALSVKIHLQVQSTQEQAWWLRTGVTAFRCSSLSNIGIVALNLRQNIFWRRVRRTAGGLPVIRIVAKSSGFRQKLWCACFDLELYTKPSLF